MYFFQLKNIVNRAKNCFKQSAVKNLPAQSTKSAGSSYYTILHDLLQGAQRIARKRSESGRFAETILEKEESDTPNNRCDH